MLKELIQPTETVFPQDRRNTVGASEIGLCARRTWFKKRDTPEDTPHPGWGYRERGHVVERWVTERLADHVSHVQHFVHRGFRSATVDLVFQGDPVDIKSFDPRLVKMPKHEHVMQAQQQADLMDRPQGHLLYVNCSDFEDMREFSIPRADHSARARAIMTGPMPPPEGRITGDGECALCPFQIACLGTPIEGKGHLTEADLAAIAAAKEDHRRFKDEAEAASSRANASKERIRDVLRAADVHRAPGLARVSRSARTTLDTKAMEADGIDLSLYRKAGSMSETVTME